MHPARWALSIDNRNQDDPPLDDVSIDVQAMEHTGM
jgi:hypothetical protein